MNLPTSKTLPELDYQELDYLLEKTKYQVFMGKNSLFLGSIMSTTNFVWDTTISTAATNGTVIVWNPYYFLSLTPRGRVTILKHELWHVGYLDCIRVGSRNHLAWNYACDIRINNHLHNEGEACGISDVKINLWLDHAYDGMSPEDIYDKIYPQDIEDLVLKYGEAHDDLSDPEIPSEVFPQKIDKWTVLNNLIASVQSTAIGGGGGAGSVPGEVETTLKRFLAPKLPWNQLLFNFFNENYQQDYSMKKPNRRFQDMYLPSLVDSDEGGLDHLMFFGDVSGSVNDAEFTRYCSEVKYIKDHFNPEKLTFVQFDMTIQSIKTWEQNELFDEVVRKGYGGTSLDCVRSLILEKKPTAVVILSDLQCTPMEPIAQIYKVPLLWVAVNNGGAKVNEGKLIFMRD